MPRWFFVYFDFLGKARLFIFVLVILSSHFLASLLLAQDVQEGGGIKGTVVLMPGSCEKNGCPHVSDPGIIKVGIWKRQDISPGQEIKEALPQRGKPGYPYTIHIKDIQTDPKGQFVVYLPPGVYLLYVDETRSRGTKRINEGDGWQGGLKVEVYHGFSNSLLLIPLRPTFFSSQ